MSTDPRPPAIAPHSTTREAFGDAEVTTTHPAYGSLELQRRHYSPGGVRLFGSELVHHETMHVVVRRTESYRLLNGDRIAQGQILCEFDLSLAQWSSFISSSGMGGGTHCTLDKAQIGRLEFFPEIDQPAEQHVDKFKREMEESVRKRLEGITLALNELSASGRCTGAARESLRDAMRHAEQLASSIGFVNDRFAESTEHIISTAKSELEGFVVGLAQRTGIKALADATPSLDVLERP